MSDWPNEFLQIIQRVVNEFVRESGYPESLELSEPYEMHDGKTTSRYPNADSPGVYIFISEQGVLNIGKSRRTVGSELHRDIIGWVIPDYASKGKRVVLVTIPTATVFINESDEVPAMLEKFLQKRFPEVDC